LRFSDDRIVVWCGGNFEARVGSAFLAAGHPAVVRTGEEFSIQSPSAGCRAWLAISGGIDVPVVLGSRAGDLRAGFGGVKGGHVNRCQDTSHLPAAIPPGTAQVTPSPYTVALLSDCPSIGRYQQIAHVITFDCSRASQQWPGDRVPFSEVSKPAENALLLQL